MGKAVRFIIAFIVAAFASTLQACSQDDIDADDNVYPFDCYDIMLSNDATADDATGKLKITKDADPWRPGDIVYLERDGLFVYRGSKNTWSRHWGYASLYGSYLPKGVRPKPCQKYYCKQTATRYVADDNGRLVPEDTYTGPIRVTTWNVGGFNNGNSGKYHAPNREKYQWILDRFAPVIKLLDADLIGFCEYLPSIFDDQPIRSDLMSEYPYDAISEIYGDYKGKAFFSRFPLSNPQLLSLEKSVALEADVTIGGRIFKICICHPVWWTTDGNPNRKALEQLAQRYKYIDRVILMGDFNFPLDAEQESLKIFTDAGFSAANLSSFGRLRTAYNTQISSPALDNIFIKGARIISVSVVQYTPAGLDPANPLPADEPLWDAANPSDHFPLSALLLPL